MARVSLRSPRLFLLPLAFSLAVTVVVPGALVAQAQSATRPLPGRAAPTRQTSERPLRQFAGLGRIFRDLFDNADAANPDELAGRRFDFDQVTAAVTAVGPAEPSVGVDGLRDSFEGTGAVRLVADARALSRDDTAYRLHSLGYSAKEIADMLAGRITRRALDNAQKMLMLGWTPERVSNLLDREYKRMASLRVPARPGTRTAPAIDALVARYASQYAVDPALVRAVIASESGWDPAARSRVGAIGLMQLMPGTAAALGVNPFILEQNIEGGVRYLAGLLRAFGGNIERALIAYNAGPGFAGRFIRGEVALYGETRDYVRDVMRRLAGR